MSCPIILGKTLIFYILLRYRQALNISRTESAFPLDKLKSSWELWQQGHVNTIGTIVFITLTNAGGWKRNCREICWRHKPQPHIQRARRSRREGFKVPPTLSMQAACSVLQEPLFDAHVCTCIGKTQCSDSVCILRPVSPFAFISIR